MNVSVGIVGLPNVGKSTLFNALTNAAVDAQNYPYCTIEPNKGIVAVNDSRLDKLAEIVKTQRKINAVIEFVDIAGLVKGASQGAGLGNQFLANIREVAAIAHVVRVFKDSDIIHIDGKIDPKSDIETIEMELIFKDIESLQNKINTQRSKARSDKEAQMCLVWMEKAINHLENGNYLITLQDDSEKITQFRKELFLLTDKPQIYIFNKKSEDIGVEIVNQHAFPIIELDIKLEYELSQLSADEKKEYLEEFGLEFTGLEKLAKSCYKLLGLIYFFTAGEKEVRAWTVKKGDTIKKAAGAIHTDFEKNFIAADVVSYDDFVQCGGWHRSKEKGKVRLEGKDYIVKEGDVVIIKHN